MTSDPIARYLATRGMQLGRRERLRVMNPSELLNASLRVYRQLGWTYLRLTLVPSTFCLAGVAFVLDYVVPSLFITHHANQFGAQIVEAAGALALALLVGGPLFLIGCSYTCSVVVHLTSDFMLGNEIDPEGAARIARANFGALLVVALRELLLSSLGVTLSAALLGLGAYISQVPSLADLGGLIFGIGIIGICVGFLIFLIVLGQHSLAPAIVVLEGLSGKLAATRSKYLQKSQFHHPSGTGGVLNALIYVCFVGAIEYAGIAIIFSMLQAAEHAQGLVSGLPFEGLFVSAFGLLSPFLVIWTMLPVYATCVTIIYYERRIRLEGLDIEVLAAESERVGASNRFDV